MNRKTKRVRWGVSEAAHQFDVPKSTLAAKLRSVESPDQKYSVAQIAGALFGEREIEKAKLLKTRRKTAELEFRRLSSELVPLAWFERIIGDCLLAGACQVVKYAF